MNVFNRVLLIILLAGLAALAIAVIIFTWASPDSATNVLEDGVDWLEANQGDLEKTLISSGAGLVALLAITLIYLELTPQAGSEVGVIDLKGGSATLSTDAVSQRIEEAIARVPFVSDSKVNVEGRRKGVVVGLDVNVDPQANLAQVTDDVCDTVRDVLANRVHVALLEAPNVRLHYREPRAGRTPRHQLLAQPSSRSGATDAAGGTAPALAAYPAYSLPQQPEPDAHPFNGVAPERRIEPASGPSTQAYEEPRELERDVWTPPSDTRPAEEDQDWTPAATPARSTPPGPEEEGRASQSHRPEPLYSRPEPEAEPDPYPYRQSQPSRTSADYDAEQPPVEEEPRDDRSARPTDPYRGNA